MLTNLSFRFKLNLFSFIIWWYFRSIDIVLCVDQSLLMENIIIILHRFYILKRCLNIDFKEFQICFNSHTIVGLAKQLCNTSWFRMFCHFKPAWNFLKPTLIDKMNSGFQPKHLADTNATSKYENILSLMKLLISS